MTDLPPFPPDPAQPDPAPPVPQSPGVESPPPQPGWTSLPEPPAQGPAWPVPPGQESPPDGFQSAWSGPQQMPPQPPKRSGGVIIAVVMAVIAFVLVIALAAALLLGRTSSNETSESSTSEGASELPTPTSVAPDSTVPGVESPSELELPEVPEGFVLVSDEAKGYAFVMPEEWESTPLTAEDIDRLSAQLEATNPELAGALEQFKTVAAAGGLAFAYDPAGTAGNAPSLNLLGIPSGGLTAEQIVAQAELGLGAVDAKLLSKTPVTNGNLDGVMVEIQVAVSGQEPVVQRQLYLAGERTAYVMTVNGADDEQTEVILRSLRGR